MKKISLTVILLSITQALPAQDFADKLFIDFNMTRYAPASSGYYDRDEGTNEFSVVNAFSLGYRQNQRLAYFVELRNVNSYIEEYSFDSFKKYSTNGIETSLGFMFFTREVYRFSAALSIEGFAEFTKVRGLQTVGDITLYEVNHRKNYFGVAPGLTVNFKITERIYLFAKTRYRLGKVSYEGVEHTVHGTTLWHDSKFSGYYYDPLSAFGLRIFISK